MFAKRQKEMVREANDTRVAVLRFQRANSRCFEESCQAGRRVVRNDRDGSTLIPSISNHDVIDECRSMFATSCRGVSLLQGNKGGFIDPGRHSINGSNGLGAARRGLQRAETVLLSRYL